MAFAPCTWIPVLLAVQAASPWRSPQRVRAPVDVPLRLLPGSSDLGLTSGVSFLDFDADGWIDLFVALTGELRRNVGGLAFPLVADLDVFLPGLPPFAVRYGAACGDYDEDGLPDIAGEPRGNTCLYLLKNLDAAGAFLDVAQDPAIIPAPLPCGMEAETFCWADVDDDGDLDLFAPAYPDDFSPGSGGNHFYENLGATGPGGAHRFALSTSASGLEIPQGIERPEGAQFADADRDGDLDLYSNATFYQNRTLAAGPRFAALDGGATGIFHPPVRDEGVLFFDHDMDGDQDLFVLVANVRNALFDNRGDGTFVELADVFEAPEDGTAAGCSAADWDLDGDLDLTTTHRFRRNLLVETGEAYLRLATNSVVQGGALKPSWGDWDHDGDLDCALSNDPFPAHGVLLQNTTYSPSTPSGQRLALRVRPLKDSARVPRGLENEFGASVEVRVRGDASGRIRRSFTTSSHGYLNQSEYALTFGLPAGPHAGEPARDVVFDLVVDFPSRGDRGVLRIDRSVNPALGGIELASLAAREIAVFRGGRVRIDGHDYAPAGPFALRLSSTGGLALPGPGTPLAELVPASAPGWWVGLELETSAAPGPTLLAELVLDGQLEPVSAARCDANAVLWDVTPGEVPRAVERLRLTTSPRNARSFLALDTLLKPQRVYRFLCRMQSLRASPLVPRPGSPATNRGGLSLHDPDPCGGAALVAAPVDPEHAFLELRYRASSTPLHARR